MNHLWTIPPFRQLAKSATTIDKQIRCGLLDSCVPSDLLRPTTDFAEIAAKFLPLARLVVPELDHLPWYVIGTSQLPINANATLGAATGPAIFRLARDFQPRRYRGPGPCIVVNDELKLLKADRHPWPTAVIFTEAIAAVLIHELAHVAEQTRLYSSPAFLDDDHATKSADNVVRFLAMEHTAQTVYDNGDDSPPPWQFHETEFIRAVIHVLYRLSRFGVLPAIDPILSADTYGLSPLSDYAEALAVELTPGAIVTPWQDLLATEPPQQFTNLWTADTCQQTLSLGDVVMSNGKTIDTSPEAVLARLEKRESERQKMSQSAIWQLVYDVAAGEADKYSDEQIEDIMKTSNFTHEKFRDTVRLVKQRLSLSKQVEQYDELMAQQTEWFDKRDKELDRFEKLHDAHLETMAEINSELDYLKTQIRQSVNAREALLQTLPDWRKRDLDRLQAELNKIAPKATAEAKELALWEGWSDLGRHDPSPKNIALLPAPSRRMAENALRFQMLLPEKRQKVAALREQVEKLQSEIRQCELEALLP